MILNHSNHLEVVHTEFLCSGLKHPKVIYIFNSNTPLPYKRYKGLTTSETWGTTCFPLTHSKLNQCKQLQSKKIKYLYPCTPTFHGRNPTVYTIHITNSIITTISPMDMYKPSKHILVISTISETGFITTASKILSPLHYCIGWL